MDTTIKALQNLYVAMGGDLSDVENLVITPDMVNAIAELVESGGISGGGLPDVTAADNGKILIVSNGEWVAATPTPTIEIAE